MNFLQCLCSMLAFFAITAEAIKWGKAVLKMDTLYAPLALTRKHGSTSLDLAIPHRYERSTVHAEYYYITENENGPTEEFLTACSALNDNPYSIGNKWIFFLLEYQGADMNCVATAAPRIQRARKYCGSNGAEIFEIGYEVSTDNKGKDIKFLSVYEICYSEALATQKPHQGTLYTVHRIVSPSLMLLKLIEDYTVKTWNSYTSFLDTNLRHVVNFYEDYDAFKFVGKYDMPTSTWQHSTNFPFNYTPIPQQSDLRKGMISIDNYLRLFSLKNDKKLSFHSGTYELTTEVKSFWRIVIDEQFNAILIVTQYSETELQNCGGTYISTTGCGMLKEYEHGGCSYMCPVSNEIIGKLGSPQFHIQGILLLTIEFLKQNVSSQSSQTTRPGKEIMEGSSYPESETVTAEMSDFLGEEPFSVVLMKFDNELANMITDSTEIRDYNMDG